MKQRTFCLSLSLLVLCLAFALGGCVQNSNPYNNGWDDRYYYDNSRHVYVHRDNPAIIYTNKPTRAERRQDWERYSAKKHEYNEDRREDSREYREQQREDSREYREKRREENENRLNRNNEYREHQRENREHREYRERREHRNYDQRSRRDRRDND